MPTPLTLDVVQAQFEQWRQQKKSPQCRVPADLKNNALALRDQYTEQDITKVLKIPPARFQSWEQQPLQRLNDNAHAPNFVSLAPELIATPPDAMTDSPNTIQFTCTHANGTQWQLRGKFTVQQLSAVVTTLSTNPGGPQ